MIRAGLCTETERANCEVENDGDLDWACENCPKGRYENLHDYTKKLLKIRGMQRAGYPFTANDLTVDEWLDLGQIKEELDSPGGCPFI